MTLERASELVNALLVSGNEHAAIDLFSFFDTVLRISRDDDNGRAISDFAEMCGWAVARDVQGF